MTSEEAMKSLALKFKSGNGIPVTRAAITLEEYEAIKTELARLQEENDEIRDEMEVSGVEGEAQIAYIELLKQDREKLQQQANELGVRDKFLSDLLEEAFGLLRTREPV